MFVSSGLFSPERLSAKIWICSDDTDADNQSDH